ncbi:hypothetical protein CYMTET_32889 [Cymbomonas tetramitiformis]|uniref:Uncharacterized protein n=1 Tax=Cymbomonas tetramitiformis TaxID=36881 RepID=A0AAE0KRR8_9CHLO|nr:hypothetical protein CYMTET_32889 [Cymbomonas tetramitiformis]
MTTRMGGKGNGESTLLRNYLPLLVACLAWSAQAEDIVLDPKKTGGDTVALIIFPGSELASDQYTSTAEAIQDAASSSIWVGIVDAASSTQFDSAIPRILASMSAKGMSASKTFYASHSPAESALLQDYLSASIEEKSQPDGLVLLGSFVLRKYRTSSGGFRLPTLTLGGDADGLCRVTRIAEAFAVDKGSSSVIVLPGVSHMQFASGAASSVIQKHDLKPEVSEASAHSSIGRFVAAFLDSNREELAAGSSATATVLDPIVEAMRQEGSQKLNALCNSDFPTSSACNYPKWPDASLDPLPVPKPDPMPPSDCICGSSFVEENAQKLMARFDLSPTPSASFFSKDSFHDVSDTHPFHLPHIFNDCEDPASCLLNTTSVTMPIYEDGDPWHRESYVDDGLTPISAKEFRTKLKSRQAMWQAAGFSDDITKDIEKTDGSLEICKSINQASYDWALSSASPAAKAKFSSVGEPYVFVDDVVAKIGVTGPEWIKDAMVYKRTSSGMTVQSWTFKTENTNHGHVPYIVTAGYHYCKILSPFRAMEWITVDGLRLHGSLASETVTLDGKNNATFSSRKMLQ